MMVVLSLSLSITTPSPSARRGHGRMVHGQGDAYIFVGGDLRDPRDLNGLTNSCEKLGVAAAPVYDVRVGFHHNEEETELAQRPHSSLIQIEGHENEWWTGHGPHVSANPSARGAAMTKWVGQIRPKRCFYAFFFFFVFIFFSPFKSLF